MKNKKHLELINQPGCITRRSYLAEEFQRIYPITLIFSEMIFLCLTLIFKKIQITSQEETQP